MNRRAQAQSRARARARADDPPEIVKVQLPVAPALGGPALIYDRERTVQHVRPLTDAELEQMGGAVKAFFYARLDASRSGWALLRRAPDQTW